MVVTKNNEITTFVSVCSYHRTPDRLSVHTKSTAPWAVQMWGRRRTFEGQGNLVMVKRGMRCWRQVGSGSEHRGEGCVLRWSCLSPSHRNPGIYLWWPRDAFAWNQGHCLAGDSGWCRKAWQVLHEIQHSLNKSILLSHGHWLSTMGNDIKSSFNTLKQSKD